MNWSERWVKLTHLQPGQWDRICDFIRETFKPIDWQLQPWTSKQVTQILASKKKSSATGADGVSLKDLKGLPPQAHSILAKMFNAIETSNVWPKQLTVGVVSSLDKMKGGGTVDSYRPITIYPILYRAWSSHRARQALKVLAAHLPASVCGGVPGKQARAVWFEVSQLLEGAHFGNTNWQGVMLDIRRAFNALPRQPIWAMLEALQFPQQLTRTWGSFVSSQVRRFKMRQSTGIEIPSVVGLPEGCALSVMGMVLIDWLFDEFLSAQWQLPKQLYLYVDDWHIAFQHPQAYPDLLRTVHDFATQLDLEIDVTKSFAWGSHAQDRKILKEGDLTVTLAARDLGAHQNFSLKSGNKVVTDRIRQLSLQWPKLRGSVAPYRSKVVAIKQMAWPRSMHAVSVVHLGNHHFVSLRTGALRGLRADKIGANPGLHLVTNGCPLDPEFWCISQTFREARELGNEMQMSHLLAMIGGQIPVPRNGPTMVLALRAQRLGWSVLPNGMFQDAYGSFCGFGVHWDELHFRMVSSWSQVLATFVSHRRSFAGIEKADLFEANRALKQFSEADQIFLRSGLDGTLYTDKTKAKEDRGRDSKCIYCQAPDSFMHRIWSDLVFHRQVHYDILQVILKVGQIESKFLGQQHVSGTDASVGRHTGGPANGHVPLQWEFSDTLIKRCLTSNLVPLHHWWTKVVVPAFTTERYEWISGIQMYIDYCFAVGGQGPIMHKGRWLEGTDEVWDQYTSASFSRRIKMFLTLWKAYIKENRLVVPAALKRPRSAGASFWCQCYQLPWSTERLLDVDRILLQICGRQLPTLMNVPHVSLLAVPRGNVLPLSIT